MSNSLNLPIAFWRKRLVLQPEEVGQADLLETGREMAVPEERHLFLEGPRSQRHAAHPPVAQVGHLRAQFLLLLLLKQLARFGIGRIADGFAPGHGGRVGLRPVRRGGGIGDSTVIDKPGDGLGHAQLPQVLDVLRTGRQSRRGSSDGRRSPCSTETLAAVLTYGIRPFYGGGVALNPLGWKILLPRRG